MFSIRPVLASISFIPLLTVIFVVWLFSKGFPTLAAQNQ
jgi:hypothetical protein